MFHFFCIYCLSSNICWKYSYIYINIYSGIILPLVSQMIYYLWIWWNSNVYFSIMVCILGIPQVSDPSWKWLIVDTLWMSKSLSFTMPLWVGLEEGLGKRSPQQDFPASMFLRQLGQEKAITQSVAAWSVKDGKKNKNGDMLSEEPAQQKENNKTKIKEQNFLASLLEVGAILGSRWP